jgi:hypothetical protein
LRLVIHRTARLCSQSTKQHLASSVTFWTIYLGDLPAITKNRLTSKQHYPTLAAYDGN